MLKHTITCDLSERELKTGEAFVEVVEFDPASQEQPTVKHYQADLLHRVTFPEVEPGHEIRITRHTAP